MTFVLCAVIVLLAAAVVIEDVKRREWKRHDAALERRVAVDEAILDALRGPRRTAGQIRREGM